MSSVKDQGPEPDENNRGKKKAEDGSRGYEVRPRDANVGQIWSLIDMAREFPSQQLTLKCYETPTQFVLDVRTDTASRAKFIEKLLADIKAKQKLIKRIYDSSPERVSNKQEDSNDAEAAPGLDATGGASV